VYTIADVGYDVKQKFASCLPNCLAVILIVALLKADVIRYAVTANKKSRPLA